MRCKHRGELSIRRTSIEAMRAAMEATEATEATVAATQATQAVVVARLRRQQTQWPPLTAAVAAILYSEAATE